MRRGRDLRLGDRAVPIRVERGHERYGTEWSLGLIRFPVGGTGSFRGHQRQDLGCGGHLVPVGVGADQKAAKLRRQLRTLESAVSIAVERHERGRRLGRGPCRTSDGVLPRLQLVARQAAVAVPVERRERFRRRVDLAGRDLAVAVRIQGSEGR